MQRIGGEEPTNNPPKSARHPTWMKTYAELGRNRPTVWPAVAICRRYEGNLQNCRIKNLQDNKTDDGKQHSEFNAYFHKSKKQFRYLQQCDALKDRLSKKLGITLIRINYDRNITQDMLIRKLKEAGVLENLIKKGVINKNVIK